jgi:asparagine N-glycosylation enzyme membrane subunit Stt3
MVKMKEINIKISSLIAFSLLLIIIYFSMWNRSGTLNSKVILDYDPWYFYRIAKMILDNNLIPPKWDLLSYFPPGRPPTTSFGWDYIMIFLYKILSIFSINMTFMDAVKLSPVIMVGLAIIPAFLLGRLLTNNWGGLITGLIAANTPTFIGVSMGGYNDTDVVVVFFSFICLYSIFLAIKKRKIQHYIFSILMTLLFIYSWWFGWYILFFFTLFIPAFIIFRILETIVHERKINLKSVIHETKPLLIPLFIIIIATNIIGYLLGYGSMLNFVSIGLGYTATQSVIVNVSVAELQPINIFTRDGFLAVAGRVGIIPMLFSIIGLPILVIYKILKKEKINFVEIFLFIWATVTFYLILSGIRFSLLFSCAIAASTGYVIGNLVKFIKNNFFGATIFGIVFFSMLIFVSDSISYAYSAGGMEVSQNWIDMLDWLKANADSKALIETWWDPGHIIAGYTGLRVHADGGHCSPGECIPFNHNIRIQDMGRIMSTSDEDEAYTLITKYKQLTPEECQEAKNKYDDLIPKEGCEPASEIYFIASSDLIGKFTWLNYFGGYRAPISSNNDFMKNPGVCCASTPKTESGQVSCGEFASQGKGVWVWCPWIFSLSSVTQDQEGNPVYLYDYAGLKMALIQKGNYLIPIYNNQFIINYLTFFYNGQEQNQDLSNYNATLERIDGLVWMQSDFKSLIYFAPAIKDSMFTRLFFYGGEGLKHFEPVFSNSEIRLYKIV